MTPIDYDVIVFKEDETCVAYCPELDISLSVVTLLNMQRKC
jgi:hypothetical protein